MTHFGLYICIFFILSVFHVSYAQANNRLGNYSQQKQNLAIATQMYTLIKKKKSVVRIVIYFALHTQRTQTKGAIFSFLRRYFHLPSEQPCSYPSPQPSHTHDGSKTVLSLTWTNDLALARRRCPIDVCSWMVKWPELNKTVRPTYQTHPRHYTALNKKCSAIDL